MSRVYKKHCDECGTYYEGEGKKYCSLDCSSIARKKKTNRSSADSPMLRMSVIEQLRAGGKHFSEMAETLVIDEVIVKNVVQSLISAGYSIDVQGNRATLMGGIPPETTLKIDVSKAIGRTITFGVVSDTHLGAINERLDVLECAYDDFARQGIKTVYHAGNIVEGESHFNKYDIRVHGITDQTLYCIDHYPQRKGITTCYITADDHEGWWFQREGIDFGRYLYLEAEKRGRSDLVHLGYQEVDIEIVAKKGRSIIRLLHPGGGTAYAISYALQKIVESFQGGEKPQIILCGHYHKAGCFYPREVHSLLCGCVSDQSRFMRKKKIQAHVGYYIVSITQDKDGAISAFTPTFKPFYDRKFYVKRSI